MVMVSKCVGRRLKLSQALGSHWMLTTQPAALKTHKTLENTQILGKQTKYWKRKESDTKQT